jgi:hypothetical protein
VTPANQYYHFSCFQSFNILFRNGWISFENISEKQDPGAACREMVPKPQKSTFRENSLSSGGDGCIIIYVMTANEKIQKRRIGGGGGGGEEEEDEEEEEEEEEEERYRETQRESCLL